MALSNMTELIASVITKLNRPDLQDSVPDMILEVEARLRRRLRSKNITRGTLLTTDPSGTPLPPDVKELQFATLAGRGALDIVSPAGYADLLEQNTVPGLPKYVCQIGDTLFFVPAPDQAYTVTIIYEPDVPPLATTEGGTNWVLAQHPDIYTYGIAVEAAPYLRDDVRVQMYDARFQQALDELELVRDRTNYPNTPVQRPRMVF